MPEIIHWTVWTLARGPVVSASTLTMKDGLMVPPVDEINIWATVPDGMFQNCEDTSRRMVQPLVWAAGHVNLTGPKAAAAVVLNPKKLFSVSTTVLDSVRGPVTTGGRANGPASSDGCALDCANVAVANAPTNRQRSARVVVMERF